jgi:hypothetical protein
MIIDVGATPEFFGNSSMMDYELMGGDAATRSSPKLESAG